MSYYGKGFNDGNDEDAPRFVPAGVEPITVIPAGQEDKYTKDGQGNWWLKTDWEKMRIKND